MPAAIVASGRCWRGWSSGRAGRSRRLLVVEDVHWADPITLAHLARLAVVASECPCLLLMTTRLDGDPIDQAWRAEADGRLADDASISARCGSTRRACWPVRLLAGSGELG